MTQYPLLHAFPGKSCSGRFYQFCFCSVAIQSDSPTKRPQTRQPYLAVLGLPAGEAVRLTLHRDVLVTGQRAVTLVAAEVLQVPESLLRACAVHQCIIEQKIFFYRNLIHIQS